MYFLLTGTWHFCHSFGITTGTIMLVVAVYTFYRSHIAAVTMHMGTCCCKAVIGMLMPAVSSCNSSHITAVFVDSVMFT
jgi:hypothetical protein